VNWEAVTVPAVRGGDRLVSTLRFATNDPSVVEVKVGDDPPVKREGLDLFEALAAVRRALEARSVMLACNGARRDVYPSAMLRQVTDGRRAYILTMPRTPLRPAVVDIFAPAPEDSVLATVDEQRAWFESWVRSGDAPDQKS
jgi:hypothetical protein